MLSVRACACGFNLVVLLWCASELDRSPRWKMSAPTTLLAFCHAREVTGYCPAGVQGTVLGIAVDLSVVSYFLSLFPSPYRAGVPGRLVTLFLSLGAQSL